MICLNITGINQRIMKGLGMVAEVRGFSLDCSGIKVTVNEQGSRGLHISKLVDGYSITYKGQTNLYRACAILCGMLEANSFEEIHETAKFERCGVMIDCSRNAVLKLEAIKEIFARLAGMGINYVMLYTEDTYEIDGYNYYDNTDKLEERFKQCTGMDMKSFMALELDDLDKKKRNVPWISTSKQVLYNDPLFGLFDKTFENEDMQSIYAKKLERIKSIDVPDSLNVLFDYYTRLIEVLMIKSGITKDMLKSYRSKNINELKKCAVVFEDLSEKVNELYKVYVRLWESMNKPFGMEVIDLRYGGLITRLNTASRCLNEYCDGKLEILEELEQERLYYCRGGAETSLEKPFALEHTHLKIISASII